MSRYITASPESIPDQVEGVYLRYGHTNDSSGDIIIQFLKHYNSPDVLFYYDPRVDPESDEDIQYVGIDPNGILHSFLLSSIPQSQAPPTSICARTWMHPSFLPPERHAIHSDIVRGTAREQLNELYRGSYLDIGFRYVDFRPARVIERNAFGIHTVLISKDAWVRILKYHSVDPEDTNTMKTTKKPRLGTHVIYRPYNTEQSQHGVVSSIPKNNHDSVFVKYSGAEFCIQTGEEDVTANLTSLQDLWILVK